jgi:hypothetical protein
MYAINMQQRYAAARVTVECYTPPVQAGVTNEAAKPDCVLPIGDNGSLYKDCSFGKLIVMKINETLLSWKQQSCQ